jgi:small neutral amino acid transporter SnatA (MarC family)
MRRQQAPAVVTPPHDVTIVPLALPFFISAGPISGTAIALTRSGAGLYYLVDNATAMGPPVWVHEGEVDTCMFEPMFVRCE